MTKQTQAVRKLAVKSVKAEGKRKIRAIISAPVVDQQGELFDTRTMIIPLRDGSTKPAQDLDKSERWNVPLVINHDLETGGINVDVRDTIGSVWNGGLNDKDELEVVIHFSSRPIALEMLTLIIEEHLLDCFSIVAWRGPADNDGVIRYSELIQLGLVWKGANQNARVLEVIAKALGKERDNVTKIDVEAKKKELAAKQAEVEALEAEINEADAAEASDPVQEIAQPTETTDPVEPEDETKEVDEVVTEEEPKSEDKQVDDEEPAETTTVKTSEKEEENNKVTKIAAKAAAGKPNTDVRQEAAVTNNTEREDKELAVKQLLAVRRGDVATAQQITAKAVEDGRGGYKEITGEDTATSFLQAQLDSEAAKLYESLGGVVSRVTRKTLNGNSTEYRKRIKRGRLTYAPAPYGENKKVQHTVPEWFETKVQPWAVIAAWDEEAAEDAPYDYFQDVTEDLFDGAIANDEFAILGFAGGTFKGRTYAATGILPILADLTGDDARYAQYAADETFLPTLTEALGNVVSTSRNAQFSLAMTRSTRASLAGITDGDGKLLLAGGDSIALGLLGSVDIIEVDESVVPAGQIVIGDFSQYILVEKGGVKVLGSQHASLDGVSLYQSDGDAVRARQRIGGGMLFNEAFYVLGLGESIVVPTQPTGDGS